MIVAISIGAVDVPVGDVWGIVLHHVTGARTGPADPALDQIVWNFRTPRVVLAALVGAGLAVSGAVLQTVVSNPLADPIVLGEAANTATTYGYDSVTQMQETKTTLCRIQAA